VNENAFYSEELQDLIKPNSLNYFVNSTKKPLHNIVICKILEFVLKTITHKFNQPF